MNKDYYAILGVTRDSNYIEICNKFKTLSLKYHPQNNSRCETKEGAVERFRLFSDIAESFTVLSNHRLRAAFDKLGYAKFIEGVSADLKDQMGFQFMGNAKEIFEQFFGTQDFFAALVRDEEEYNNFLKAQSRLNLTPPKDIMLVKQLRLLELYTGTEIELEFERTELEKDLINIKQVKAKK